jgi:hypothetical protein
MKAIPESGVSEMVKADLSVPDPPTNIAMGIINEPNTRADKDDPKSN